MELFRQPNSPFWSVTFYANGKRYRRSTRERTRSAALEVALQMVRLAETRGDPGRLGTVPTLADYVRERFAPFVGSSQLDADTKRYYATGIRLLLGTPLAHKSLDRITRSDSETVVLPGSGSTANCAIRTLSRCLSLAVEDGYLAASPRLKKRKERQRNATFTPEVEERILALAPQPLRDVFLLSHDSGMRPEEVIRMRWEDVLWDRSLIFIPHGKTARAKRHVPMSARVRNALRERARDSKSPWVFPSKRSKSGHISYFPIARDFGRMRRDLGLAPDLVLYSARHTFATDLLAQTGNIKLVSDVLGHESVTTTQRYLHPSKEGLAEVIDRRNRKRAAGEKHAPKNFGPTFGHTQKTVN